MCLRFAVIQLIFLSIDIFFNLYGNYFLYIVIFFNMGKNNYVELN